jgi:hypothetical protein
MTKNIKIHIPLNLLIDFLKRICINKNIFYIDKYIFNKNKKEIQDFFVSIKKYYIILNTSTITYQVFLTIIRQICNINKNSYYFKIKYIKNTYEIIYHIKNPYFLEHHFPNPKA